MNRKLEIRALTAVTREELHEKMFEFIHTYLLLGPSYISDKFSSCLSV